MRLPEWSGVEFIEIMWRTTIKQNLPELAFALGQRSLCQPKNQFQPFIY
jgi:hypothetical protein